MRILAYVHAYVPYHNAGAETTLHDFLKAFIAAGHEATVLLKQKPNIMVRNEPFEYVYEGVRVIQAVDKRDLVTHVLKSDVVLTHLESSMRASLLCKQFRVPVGHLIHNNMDLTKSYVAHGANFIVYNTDWIAEDFGRIAQFADIPSYVVHPPVNPENYRTDRGKKVTLVNLFKPKGTDVFYHLVEKFPDTQFLAVKGGYGEQDVREFPNVEFLDNSSDVRKVFAETKLVLMPSVYESFGRVAVEAAASGIPTIASPTPGLREALGDSGVLVDRSDLNGWEKALKSSLAPRKYSTLSKGALARSDELWKQTSKELDDFVFGMPRLVEMLKQTMR